MARPRGNRWQADVMIDGVRKRPTFATKEEAEAYERAIEGGYGVTSNLTLRPFVEEQFNRIWEGNRSISSIQTNLNVLYRYIPAETPLTSINDLKVDNMITAMINDGLAGGTINRKLATLSKIMKRAKKMQIVVAVPELERQKEGKGRDRIWDAADERKAELFWTHLGLTEAKCLCIFLLYTGCRVGEAYKLSRKDVQGGFVTFRETKNGATRRIPLVAPAKAAWDTMCRMTNEDKPFGDAYPRDTFRGHWERLREHFDATEDPNFVPHMLRHTCASRLVMAGVGLPQVMKWMGHKSIQTTMRYAHLAPKDLDVAAQALVAVA
ncbi:site-specific integrase [Mesorhizobium sp.]|uniref:tyrosine-type recombinase/integrase n=1 Tax=Mesorhizobium sp. TaxID=1871066 RepID=UPI000FE7F49D|nr:site-specific integrase [Mesorhizobium sp.]RWM84285.1 MAG: site-specific integrase [Mesorhizobium sp.]